MLSIFQSNFILTHMWHSPLAFDVCAALCFATKQNYQCNIIHMLVDCFVCRIHTRRKIVIHDRVIWIETQWRTRTRKTKTNSHAHTQTRNRIEPRKMQNTCWNEHKTSDITSNFNHTIFGVSCPISLRHPNTIQHTTQNEMHNNKIQFDSIQFSWKFSIKM